MKDLSSCKHVIEYGNITSQLDFGKIFDPSKPVEFDIGCGMGRFILARAAANPGIQYVGVERQLPRVRKIDKKAERLGLSNLFLIRLEAAYTLKYLLPEHSVSKFYLFFPDPWPKRRHHGRRLFNADFRSLVWSRLIPGGEIQVATDHLDYFADMERQMQDDLRFTRVPAMTRAEEEQTDFELIFRKQNLPIGAAGWVAKTAEEIGEETLARYAREDAEREESYLNSVQSLEDDEADDAEMPDDADPAEEEQ